MNDEVCANYALVVGTFLRDVGHDMSLDAFANERLEECFGLGVVAKGGPDGVACI